MTIRSAAASDAMKKLVVERIPRLIITDIMTRQFPRVPKKMERMLPIVNATTIDRGLPALVAKNSLELLVKFFSIVVFLNKLSMSLHLI